ncbi:hypothetical protein FZW96_21210 [Bacillus sp. BGMRC 2118]|nr:hypothetical protein FZW96_21210 [Bacillus sp. BGMRC 2118]
MNSRILQENSIKRKFENIERDLKNVERRLENVGTFLQYAMDCYEETEKRIQSKIREIKFNNLKGKFTTVNLEFWNRVKKLPNVRRDIILFGLTKGQEFTRIILKELNWVSRNRGDLVNLLIETIFVSAMKSNPIGRINLEGIEYFHYEKRIEQNSKVPTYKEVTAVNSPWILLPPSQSILQDNKDSYPEEKYIHPNGREAVFNGRTIDEKNNTAELVTDSRYVGTFNYINPSIKPEGGFPKNPEEMLEWMVAWSKFGATNIGHGVVDVAPWFLLGSKNTRDQQRFQKDT